MYDHLGKRTNLPASTGLRFGADSVLKSNIVRGFEYSDCWVDDARLVLANAQMVTREGGEVKTRTRATRAWRENGYWIVEAQDIDSGETFTWRARGLVNATGPWVKHDSLIFVLKNVGLLLIVDARHHDMAAFDQTNAVWRR